LHPGH